jgi:hypothetical protein
MAPDLQRRHTVTGEQLNSAATTRFPTLAESGSESKFLSASLTGFGLDADVAGSM